MNEGAGDWLRVRGIGRERFAGYLADYLGTLGYAVQRDELAALIAGSRSHRNDLALLWLLLDGIGNDDAALGLLLALKAADHDAVVQGTKFHEMRFQSTCWPAHEQLT